MSNFITTPTNIDIYGTVFRNPITGRWEFPVYSFDLDVINPFVNSVDVLNNDRRYQKKVADSIYVSLTETWLYKKHNFKKLLKYFRIVEAGGEGQVHLIDNLDDAKMSEMNNKYRKHILMYIEKYFISRKFVYKALQKFTRTKNVKWYDVFEHSSAVKKFLAKELEDLIKDTVYELEKKKHM